MPDPPPRPEDLSALAAQYDHPSAELPVELVERLITEGQRVAELAELLDRLKFVRASVSDTSTGLGANTDELNLDIQGRLAAVLPCPGDAPEPTTDGNVNGVLRMLFGVENTRLRRGFQGSAEQCRLYVASPSTPEQRVVASAELVGDLGVDLSIGNTLPSDILLKLTNVSGSSVGAAGTVDVTRRDYHFRLTRGDALEVLFEPASLGLPDVGSVVFIARGDGSLGLRESRGEWTCGGGGEPCLLR